MSARCPADTFLSGNSFSLVFVVVCLNIGQLNFNALGAQSCIGVR